MKKKTLHIVFPILLVANLLFGQVALNYLHTPHSLHTPGVKINSEKPNVHRHGEHCLVCSLDIVIHLLAADTYHEHDLKPEPQPLIFLTAAAVILHSTSIQDRAPPVSC